MRYAVSLAKNAPPKPTNFCVGAILVDEVSNHILSTGHTMELPGNTHAEQCCLAKYEEEQASSGMEPYNTTSHKLVLYTTMEPCNKRASGNIPCTETILKSRINGNVGIQTVYVGVREPEKFVGENTGRAKLEGAGIDYVHVPGLEAEILAIATAGHEEE
jgi:pyrimidine deaminase RibD-like protein